MDEPNRQVNHHGANVKVVSEVKTSRTRVNPMSFDDDDLTWMERLKEVVGRAKPSRQFQMDMAIAVTKARFFFYQ